MMSRPCGEREAASRPGPVLVRAGVGRRPPGVRAAAPGAGAGFFACAHRPITRFYGTLDPDPPTAYMVDDRLLT